MKISKILTLSAVLALAPAVHAAPVNINTASADEIADSLAGIGISKAQAIVDFRNDKGRFSQASDIMQVKGIGNAIFEKNRIDILTE